MNSSVTLPPPARLRAPTSVLSKILTAALGGLALFLVLATAFLALYEFNHAGLIHPGVSVAGLDLSGQPPESAAARLRERLRFPLEGRIVFQDGGSVWVASPVEVGLFLDAETSVQNAYLVGRRGGPVRRLLSQWTAWRSGVRLAPALVYDERSAQRYLEGLAAQIDRPTIEASLGVEGVEVIVRSGQVGRKMDVQATLAALQPQLQTLTDGVIPVVVAETPPVILDASEQAAIAREILSAPLTLTLPDAQEGDPGPWTFDPPALASMLAIERVAGDEGARYQVALSSEQMRPFLESLAESLAVDPVNARFIFNDETRQLEVIEAAVIGRRLDVDASLEAVNRELAQGEHNISLAFVYQDPPAGDSATAESLGITGLVSAETSYFYGSSGARIQNIQTAAGRFHGLLVGPGETFSMAQALGDISLDSGYAEALIIFGSRTIQGVGGGVCQVSTTLFRTVFFGGFPVAERHPHAYRVYYYELTAGNRQNADLAGLDATVYVPLVDFKFTNDTPYWLLMETYVNPSARTLTWKFYSTSDGRTVEWQTTGLRNKVEPPDPLYQENPELAKGEIKQVDWAVEGADITVNRTVVRDGQVYFQDSYFTHYRPWRAVYEYGPKTKGIPTQEPTGEPQG